MEIPPPPPPPLARLLLMIPTARYDIGELGGGGGQTQKVVYRKWPTSKAPSVNWTFSHYKIWVQRAGGAGGWGG